MTILSQVYSGHDTADPLIPCLEISSSAFAEPIRNCAGFEDQTVTLEDDTQATFIASGLDVALPARDGSGQQRLTFAVAGVPGDAQRMIDASIEAGEPITVIYREYLASDLSAPARQPITMLATQPEIQPDGTVQVTCSYRNLLDWLWPRKRYTADFAPGLLSFR